jgi:ABC-type nickel/cobalt efflux system permease component RcnA
MPDWFAHLAAWQGEIVRSLAAELRTGGLTTAALAFALGALHALTPGHGKAALATYFLGTEARPAKGVAVALWAALLHVLSGFIAFLVLRFIVGRMPFAMGRPSAGFSLAGYALIGVAGLMMLIQSLRPAAHPHSAHALTAGIGLLPCPLTISVLGFAWVQSTAPMVALVLLSLTAGIATTIGAVALLAIVLRSSVGAALVDRLPALERNARLLQGVAGAAILAIALWTGARLLLA